MEKEFEKEIQANPFDNLSETDLIFLLEHNKDSLSEAQILDVESRISRFQNNSKEVEEMQKAEPVKVNILTPNNKAGFINIAVLMLSVWATSMLCLAYVYTMLNIW